MASGTAGMKHNLTLVVLTPEQIARAKAANGNRKRITHALVCGPYGQMFGTERPCFTAGDPDHRIEVAPGQFRARERRRSRPAIRAWVAAFSGFARTASRKLDQLDAATDPRDLSRPGNRLEPLRGRCRGQWSIRINDQWRICFVWPDGSPGPDKVEIVDYHR